MGVWCTACGSRLGPAGLPSRLLKIAFGTDMSPQATNDLMEAAQMIENFEPAVAKPVTWTMKVTRYRDPQNHPHEIYTTVQGRRICTNCGYDIHEKGCGR